MKETTPNQAVSEASVEDRLAAAFEKSGMRDSPEEPEADDESAEPEAQEAEPAEDQEEQSQPEPEAEETDDSGEEVEYEGKQYKLPKELKDALLRQQDYTRKTQEVAANRRMLEERAQGLKAAEEFQQANSAKVAEAMSLQSQLQQFAQVNWAELADANPAQYLQLDRQQRMLQEALGRVNADLQHLGAEFQKQQQERRAKAQAQCIEELKRDFKDFGPELLRSLDETGKAFGFSGDELAQVTDPRMIRVLHAAAQYKKLQGSKSIAQKKVQDAKPVQVKAARSAQNSQANAKTQELRDRLRKTGRAQDAEAFLASRFASRMR